MVGGLSDSNLEGFLARLLEGLLKALEEGLGYGTWGSVGAGRMPPR